MAPHDITAGQAGGNGKFSCFDNEERALGGNTAQPFDTNRRNQSREMAAWRLL
jgi:hypothetical protein